MSKRYCFDYKSYSNMMSKLYPVTFYRSIDYSTLTEERFKELRNIFEYIINNPIQKDEIIVNLEEEEIVCLPLEVKKIFDDLFKNKDLMIYGHGGAGSAIINSEGIRCKSHNLLSHFVRLSKTNSSLSALNNWPHGNASQIAILVLNSTEYNPIYREIENEYSDVTEVTDRYLIPNEYFVGYYDNLEKRFILNPNFSIIHNYDPKNTVYEDERLYSASVRYSKDSIISEFFMRLQYIDNILQSASRRNLSRESYINVVKQVIKHFERAEELQKKLTPEYLNNLMDTERKEQSTIDYFGIDDIVDIVGEEEEMKVI